MEERWDPERDDPEVVALLEAFLANHVVDITDPQRETYDHSLLNRTPCISS
jgi:hypothetical protein